MKRILVATILFLAFCGLSDSVYLAEHEATSTPLVCNIQGLTGCNIVATSSYSHLFGIPTAQLGIAFYSVLFIIAALELALFTKVLRRALQGLSLVGTVASVVFVGLQVFVIHAYCIYCLASAIIEVIIFALALGIEPVEVKDKKRNEPPLAPPQFESHLSMPPLS